MVLSASEPHDEAAYRTVGSREFVTLVSAERFSS